MKEPNPPENRNVNTGGGNYNERIEGDYIQGNLFKRIIFSVFQWTNNIFIEQTLAPVGDPTRPKNQRLLLADVKQEVTARLKQSLHNAVLINLGKELQPQQVKRPWDAEIKIGLKPTVPLPDTTTILEVFDSQEIAGKLLILGAPGSGKTTTQLELAQALVNRAEEQPDYPVPVLFNLSSWKDDRQSITDWLVAELKSKYGVSKKLGKDWVDNHQLLPLLDGLDELESQRQELCVHAINQFLAGETKPFYLVVCSRSEEYNNYSTQLKLNGAISLHSLTNNQIFDYLTTINSIELWSDISNDLDLLELVKTPLLLSITVLASQEMSVEEWQHLTSTTDRIQYLLDAYIGRMLTRDINSRAYLKNKTPNARQTRMWLVWLAKQMLLESKTEFLIEEMQPSLLKTKILKVIYNLIVWGAIQQIITFMLSGELSYKQLILGLIYGLIHGLINSLFGQTIEYKLENIDVIRSNKIFHKTNVKSLIIGLILGVIYGILWGLILGVVGNKIILWLGGDKIKVDKLGVIVIGTLKFSDHNFKILMIIILMIFSLNWGLTVGLIGGLIGDKIEGIETLKFSYQNFKTWLISGLIYVLSIGLSIGLILRVHDLIRWLIFGLASGLVGLAFGLIGGVIFGFYGVEIENKTMPNQGIWLSAKNTVKLSALFSLPSIILIFLIQIIQKNNNVIEVLISSLLSGLFFGLFVGILRGGTPVIKHFTLRLILHHNKYIPWNYARFLNYCTERLFLQCVGGRYRFIHKLLQDHFAQMEFRRD